MPSPSTAARTTPNPLEVFKYAIEQFDSFLKIRRHRVMQFEPKIRLQFEKGHFLIKTAHDGQDLEKCLRLRFDVFHREYMGRNRRHGVDVDDFDLRCDHLMIIDQRNGKAIGTYRLNCTRFTTRFYAATEFNLAPLLALPGHKLEMGRACIDKSHRNGAVMGLLWRGIAQYISMSGSDWLFGCTSLKTTSLMESERIFQWLRSKNLFSTDLPCLTPTPDFRLPGFLSTITPSTREFAPEEVTRLIPTLFQSYIRAGAKICSEPALDREFGCVDFLTVLRMEEMTPLFARKYRT